MLNNTISIGYDLVKSFFFDLPFLYTIYFITARCPSRCKTCFYWRRQDAADASEELTLDQIVRFSNSFKTIILSITGGEPFLREDLVQACFAFCKNSGVKVLSIPTGAQFPDRIDSFIKDVSKTYPRVTIILKLSLDGLFEKHDEYRMTPGNFKSFLETANRINKRKAVHGNIKMKICTTVSSFNYMQLPEIIDFVFNEVKPDYHSLKLLHGEPRGGPDCFIDSSLFNEKIAKIKEKYRSGNPLSFIYSRFQNLAQKELARYRNCEKRRYRCRAGKNFIVIRENGEVLPCEMIDSPIGNIKDYGYSLSATLANKKLSIPNDCSCDWECAPTFSILYDPKGRLDLIKSVFNTI